MEWNLMPFIGWVCVHTVLQYFQMFEILIPWIALILLCFIGGLYNCGIWVTNGACSSTYYCTFDLLYMLLWNWLRKEIRYFIFKQSNDCRWYYSYCNRFGNLYYRGILN